MECKRWGNMKYHIEAVSIRNKDGNIRTVLISVTALDQTTDTEGNVTKHGVSFPFKPGISFEFLRINDVYSNLEGPSYQYSSLESPSIFELSNGADLKRSFAVDGVFMLKEEWEKHPKVVTNNVKKIIKEVLLEN